MRERDVGFSKLNNCVEAGERLYPGTAPDGRETIRQELRQLKLGHEALFDDLSTIHRKLEVSLVQWTSFDESYGQVGTGIGQLDLQLSAWFGTFQLCRWFLKEQFFSVLNSKFTITEKTHNE